MKRVLWLLLPPALVVVARMHVEWTWFVQFNWQSVLLQRWMLQLLFAGVASVPVVLFGLWYRAFTRTDDPPRQQLRPIQGLRFSLLLLVSGVLFLATSVVLSDLAVLAWKQPFSLSHWQDTGLSMGSDWKALLPCNWPLLGCRCAAPSGGDGSRPQWGWPLCWW
jgi:hypothetical protein